MQNKVTVTIAGQEYTLLAAENASYMKKVAAHVDEKVLEVLQGGRVSLTDTAILAALNLADEFFKEQEVSAHLRTQLKGYLEEINALNNQLSESKREIFRLQTQLENRAKRSRESKSREEKVSEPRLLNTKPSESKSQEEKKQDA